MVCVLLHISRPFHLTDFKLFSLGSHPELIHLQKELRKRRDKRLELSSRKRTYETVNVTKRRRVDEEATWSWWKVRYDDCIMVVIF